MPGLVTSEARTTRPHPDGSEPRPRRRSTAATGATISAAPSTMAMGGHAALAAAGQVATTHDASTPMWAPAIRRVLWTRGAMADETDLPLVPGAAVFFPKICSGSAPERGGEREAPSYPLAPRSCFPLAARSGRRSFLTPRRAKREAVPFLPPLPAKRGEGWGEGSLPAHHLPEVQRESDGDQRRRRRRRRDTATASRARAIPLAGAPPWPAAPQPHPPPALACDAPAPAVAPAAPVDAPLPPLPPPASPPTAPPPPAPPRPLPPLPPLVPPAPLAPPAPPRPLAPLPPLAPPRPPTPPAPPPRPPAPPPPVPPLAPPRPPAPPPPVPPLAPPRPPVPPPSAPPSGGPDDPSSYAPMS